MKKMNLNFRKRQGLSVGPREDACFVCVRRESARRKLPQP